MLLLILAFWFLGLVAPIEIDPLLHQNQLRFPWGINFKYHGKLHHNLARVWVVTKFNLPPREKFNLPPADIEPDCEFNYMSNLTQKNISSKYRKAADTFPYVRPRLASLCMDSKPLFHLMATREKFLRETLLSLVEKDLYQPLIQYRSPGRSKRFASLAISAVTGLVTLAVEGISGYLQDKRNKAMANAMDALHKAQADTYDQLQRYKDDLTLYGTYSLKSTTDVLDSLEGMLAHQSSLSEIITNLPSIMWPLLYQSWGGHTTYGTHLALHAMTQSHKLDFLYELLINKIQSLVKGIATLSKGYLPPELFPPSFLNNITNRVAQELHKDHRSFKLAFDHDTAYYDLPLATFSLDESLNIIVTFPVFIVPLRHESLSLFEIETVPVLIQDLDPSAQSYSEVQVQKPYFAASDSAYIQLHEPELFHCKKVEGEFFCEETFMVKHSQYHTCESTLFYNQSAEMITSYCQFSFYHNKTVPTSVLDGGENLILANVHLEHSPTCDPKCLPCIPS